MKPFALWIIIIGCILIIAGVILLYAPWLFGWFGKLPGDVRIEREHSRLSIPITSMVLISLGLTLLINLIIALINILKR
ncbi:MAG: DUF2905 domain-containing protein [Bacteroidales bacterium]|nr:DUF2905 domain-containing protein [Bacteroidales bacterium]